ncbi:MAG: Alpha/beta hydrolase family protein [Sediminibacterium sp.]|nr:Alpha/beta hydrolase family protein [Sediminibacterium sp.]
MWMLLKYCRYKKYRSAYAFLVLVMIAFLSSYFVFYKILVAKGWEGLYPVVFIILAVATICYSASLIFSRASERKWLKAAGVFGMIIQLTEVALTVWRMNGTHIQPIFVLVDIQHWISLANALVPVLMIVNFNEELKELPAGNEATALRPSLKFILGGTAILLIAGIYIFGQNLAEKKEVLPAKVNEVNEGDRYAAALFTAGTYVNKKGDTMRYRFMKPIDYDQKKEYPLVVCLHHGGAHGNDNIKQVAGSALAQVLVNPVNSRKYPAFIFIPQCPPGYNWGGAPGASSVEEITFEAIAAFEKEFKTDIKRCYVNGESMGGYGSWHFICVRPQMFAAAIPLCGGEDPRLAANSISVPVWAFHGAKDKNVPVNFSRDMIAAIKKAGGNPRYTEYPDRDHGIWDKVKDEPGLFDWLFAQKKK